MHSPTRGHRCSTGRIATGSGRIEIAVWDKTVSTDNGDRVVYSVTCQRSYRKQEGGYENTGNFLADGPLGPGPRHGSRVRPHQGDAAERKQGCARERIVLIIIEGAALPPLGNERGLFGQKSISDCIEGTGTVGSERGTPGRGKRRDACRTRADGVHAMPGFTGYGLLGPRLGRGRRLGLPVVVLDSLGSLRRGTRGRRMVRLVATV